MGYTQNKNYIDKKDLEHFWVAEAINTKQDKALSNEVAEALSGDDAEVHTLDDALLRLNEKAGTGSGEPGFSPTVEVTKTGKVTTVTITDKDGAHTATINDGEDGTDGAKGDKGDDGVSPTISAVRVSNGVQLTITDKNGSHTAVINDGIGDGITVSTFSDVPSDGKSYLRQNSIWVEGATKEELAEIGSKVGELEKKTENISTESATTEEDAIVITTDAGVQVGKIDEKGADFKNLKSNGKEVITEHQDISQLATKTEVNKKQDKLIAGKNITISADGKTISAEGGVGDLPITKESSTSEDDSIVFADDSGKPIMRVTPTQVMVSQITDMEGNPISGGGNSIKILCFGNSFTEDSMSYVPAMLKNIDPNLNFVIGVAFIGGCTLAKHCTNFTGEGEVTSYSYRKFKNSDSKWVWNGSRDVDFMLGDENWDVITFQQAGSYSYLDWETYYEPYIHKIHKALFSKYANKTFKLGWILTHGTYTLDETAQRARWEGTMENAKKILAYTPTEVIFPYGTAVQNLRTTPLNSAGVGGENVGFLGDSAHLHEGIGTMTANYANVLTVLNLAGYNKLSVIGEPTRVTIDWNKANNTMTPHYGSGTPIVYGVTEDNVCMAQNAAIQAFKYPFDICTWDGKSFKKLINL